MISYITCGMQFGDEAKGSFVDYLVNKNEADCVVRYNGGSQASHTVITPCNKLHKFSQLGSGMFYEKCHTYITENMVVNLDNLLTELKVFSRTTGINLVDLIKRIHIHENCYVVTPYHKLINKLREFSLGENRRGTVGTGVSEVRYLLNLPKEYPYELPLGLQVKEIFFYFSNNPIISKLERLQKYVKSFYEENKEVIHENIPEELQESITKEINFLLDDNAYFNVAYMFINDIKNAPSDINLKDCIYNTYELTLRKTCKKAVFEGSQGLLLDAKYGIKPNTTYLDTIINYALDMSYYRDDIKKIGIAKAFMSRHGKGVFPTESKMLNEVLVDNNQSESYFNGKIRFGWFDAVLLRYAQSINQVDEIYLSAIDMLDNLETIKVCNEYIYVGEVDDDFKKVFNYYIKDGQTIITDIKKNSDSLTDYLKLCLPKYIDVDGWRKVTKNVNNKDNLPNECIKYIKLLENLINIKITVISVGKTRQKKIEL